MHALEHDLGSTSAWFDVRWTREVGAFAQRMADLGKGVWGVLWRRWRKWRGQCGGEGGEVAVVTRQRETEDAIERIGQGDRARWDGEDVEMVYARYLMGQAVLSDDEDDEFRFEEVDDSGSGSESEEEGSGKEGESNDDEDADISAPALYADLARRSLPPRSRHNTRSPSPTPFPSTSTGTSSALTPMLIAHLTSPARSAPLTRHRYTQLSRPNHSPFPDPASAWLQAQTTSRTRNPSHSGAIGSSDDDPRRNCVVCTVEARSVICWPCRCLALCDDCRSNLASRMGAGKHQCPCCRRK